MLMVYDKSLEFPQFLPLDVKAHKMVLNYIVYKYKGFFIIDPPMVNLLPVICKCDILVNMIKSNNFHNLLDRTYVDVTVMYHVK